MGDQRNRQHPAGAQSHAARETLRAHMHLTIPTQTRCAHGHRLDHRAIRANLRSGRVDLRLPIAQQGNICRGSANIRYQGMIASRHPASADNGRGGAAQNSFYGPLFCLLRRNQRPVTADHHQGRRQANLTQNIFRPADELMGHSDQSGIQHSR